MKIHMQMLMHQTVKDVRASDGAATLDIGIDSMTHEHERPDVPDAGRQAGADEDGRHDGDPADGQELSFTPNPAWRGGGRCPAWT